MKWKEYSALAACLSLYNQIDAQIIYTDIPDTTLDATGSSFSMDLNNDGFFDVKLKITTSVNQWTWGYDYYKTFYALDYALLPAGNSIMASGYASALTSGTPIKQNSLWDGNKVNLVNSFFFSTMHCGSGCSTVQSTVKNGPWYDVDDRFLGIRFKNAADTLYGWIRLKVSNYLDLTVKDFAFQQIPDSSILAGQTDCSGLNYLLADSSTALCNGDTIVVGGPFGFYQWLLNDSIIPSATNSTYITDNIGKYTVIITNNFGCSDTLQKFVGGVKPTITNVGDTLYSSTALTYQWNIGNTPLNGATNQFYYPSGAVYFNVITTDSSGCDAKSDDYHYTRCEWVTSDVAVVINNNTYSPPARLCDGETVTLKAPSVGYTYQWLFNDSIITGAITNQFIPDSVGTYSCIVSQFGIGCPSQNVEVYYLSEPFITQNGDTLISSSPDYNQWLYNGFPIPGATEQKYSAIEPGTYSVEVAGTSGCTVESDPIFISGIQNSELAEDPTVIVMPDKSVEVHLHSNYFIGGKIQVVNLFGQPVASIAVNASSIAIPLAQVTAGWFCVIIEKDRKRFIAPVFLY